MKTNEELYKLVNAASKGPWRVEFISGDTQIFSADNETLMCDETYYPWVPENLDDWNLIAAAPDLAAEVIRLRKALKQAAFHIEWCAGVIANDAARDRAGAFADEAREALETDK